MSTESIRLLGIPGSLRTDAYSKAVMRTLCNRMPEDVTMTLFTLVGIPPYNADDDGDDKPEAVRKLKDAIADHHGLVLCSPEYNYGMPGVLKNALDWASRPAFKSPLKHKPVLIMTSSPAFTGGVQHQLRETLAACLCRVLERPQVVIAGVKDKVRDGRLVDEATIEFALEAIDALCAEVKGER